MVVLWPCRKPGVSQCPERHNKAKPKSTVCMFDHKPDEVPVACTDEVHRKNEARIAVGPADGA